MKETKRNIVSDFKHRSKVYLSQKERFEKLKENNAYLFSGSCLNKTTTPENEYPIKSEFIKLEVKYLQENIESVENDYNNIEMICGPKAKEILWNHLVNDVPIQIIAEEENYSYSTIHSKITKYYEMYANAYA